MEYQVVGGRFISRSLFAPSGPVSFGIRSRSPQQKHHDTDSDFLEENKSLIFSPLGGRAGRRVRDWHDQDRDNILRRRCRSSRTKGRGIRVTVHFIRDDIGSFVIQRIE